MIIRPIAKGTETPTTCAPSNALLELGAKSESKTPSTRANIIATGRSLSVTDKLDHARRNTLSLRDMILVRDLDALPLRY